MRREMEAPPPASPVQWAGVWPLHSAIPPVGTQSRFSPLLVTLTGENNLPLCLRSLGVRGEILKVPISRNWFQKTLRCAFLYWSRTVSDISLTESLPVKQASCGLYSYWQEQKGTKGSYVGSERHWGHLRVISINTEGSPAMAASNGWVFKSSETNSNVLDTVT